MERRKTRVPHQSGNGPSRVPRAALAAKAKLNETARNETPEQKFKRLTNYRMTGALKLLRQVKNVAAYPHTEQQAKVVVGKLRTAIGEIERSFAPAQPAAGRKGGERFNIDEELS